MVQFGDSQLLLPNINHYLGSSWFWFTEIKFNAPNIMILQGFFICLEELANFDVIITIVLNQLEVTSNLFV